MAEVLRSRLGLAAAATAASLVLHAAVLSTAVRGTGPPPEPPAVPRVVLSLAGAAIPRLAAVEQPKASVPADEALAAPPPPAPALTESPPVAADALAALPPSPPAPAIAAEASPATDPGIPASPPTVGDIPDAAAPRETPPAPGSPAFQSIAEAAPPPSLASPPDLPAVAEAPAAGEDVSVAAGVEPPARPAQTLPKGQPAVAASDAPAPIEPSAPPLAPLRQFEASPPAPLSPLPDTVVAAVPPSSSAVGAMPVEGAPPATTPPAAETAPDTAVAALEPPPVSAERVRTFVDRYDGGPCFFASVDGAAATTTEVETFSATVDQVMDFHSAFMGQLGIEPHVVGQRVWKAQCPIVEFLRRTRPRAGTSLVLELDRRNLQRGQTLSGKFEGAGTRNIDLFLISEDGVATDLTPDLQSTEQGHRFSILLNRVVKGGPFPQVLVAVVDEPRVLAQNARVSDGSRSPALGSRGTIGMASLNRSTAAIVFLYGE